MHKRKLGNTNLEVSAIGLGCRAQPARSLPPSIAVCTRKRATSCGGGEDTPHIQEGAAPPVTEVIEYRPHEDGYLQLELRHYVRRDGSARERGPYWYFQFHEGGKRKKLYLGKTSDPESILPSGSALSPIPPEAVDG